jgi:CPA2 family monovalent cation:H+ antiporter-2
LFHEIAHSRLRELFTLAVLLVVLASAWTSYLAGLSLAMGAFLAGMMLAETEYRHQIESVIRPFRDILLGLFFISVGMLLDLSLLVSEFVLISALLAGFLIIKAAVAALATRLYEASTFKAARTGIVMSIGGEFGVALFTLILQSGAVPVRIAQALLVAVVLSMIISPFILANNARIARFVLRERRPQAEPLGSGGFGPTGTIAQREHVILCGYGRVGQSVARVLESQGFEYIALDLDPARIRAARQAGEPVLYGDSADEDMLVSAGCDHASAVVVSFSSPGVALAIVRTVRRLRADVPILVRTVDDTRAAALLAAGATQIIPETFEMGLILVAAALRTLQVPAARVAQALGQVRDDRYLLLRNVRPHTDSPVPLELLAQREEVRTVVIPPGAWAVGRSVEEVRNRGAAVGFTGIRRHGILGTAPEGATRLREGDIVLIHGRPEALEHAEGVLLAG